MSALIRSRDHRSTEGCRGGARRKPPPPVIAIAGHPEACMTTHARSEGVRGPRSPGTPRGPGKSRRRHAPIAAGVTECSRSSNLRYGRRPPPTKTVDTSAGDCRHKEFRLLLALSRRTTESSACSFFTESRRRVPRRLTPPCLSLLCGGPVGARTHETAHWPRAGRLCSAFSKLQVIRGRKHIPLHGVPEKPIEAATSFGVSPIPRGLLNVKFAAVDHDPIVAQSATIESSASESRLPSTHWGQVARGRRRSNSSRDGRLRHRISVPEYDDSSDSCSPDRFTATLAFIEEGADQSPVPQGIVLMARVDRDAPVRFLRTVFEPTDWVAIFLKSYERPAWLSASDPFPGSRANGFNDGCGR